jgi:hypothetical protein
MPRCRQLAQLASCVRVFDALLLGEDFNVAQVREIHNVRPQNDLKCNEASQNAMLCQQRYAARCCFEDTRAQIVRVQTLTSCKLQNCALRQSTHEGSILHFESALHSTRARATRSITVYRRHSFRFSSQDHMQRCRAAFT